MKNALIVTANKEFLPGLNALLNSLDYYGNTPDVHILYNSDLCSYVHAIRGRFNFRIHPFAIKGLSDPEKEDFFNYTYTRYKYVEIIKENYDVISHFDADTVILNNIMPYYEIAAKTTLFVVPASTLCQFPPEEFTDEALAKEIPFFNHPCFYNPHLYAGAIQRIWDIGQERYKVDRENDTISFNRTLFRGGILKNLLVLPGNLWLGSNTISRENFYRKSAGDKFYIHTTENHRIQSFHGKYWQPDYLEKHSKALEKWPEKLDRLTNNVTLFRRIISFFNDDCKIKLWEF